MSVPNQNQTTVDPDDQLFIRRALANVGKAERFQRAKQIVVSVLAFLAAFWFASRPSSPELGIECIIFIGVGLIMAVCTAKIMSLVNKNTKAILQAIADLHQR